MFTPILPPLFQTIDDKVTRLARRSKDNRPYLFAYGVDLTPLAFLKSELEDKLHQKQLYVQAWQETKRKNSWYRRQMRSLMLEWQGEEVSNLPLSFGDRFAACFIGAGAPGGQ